MTQDFMGPDMSKPGNKLGKRVAMAYLKVLKSENVYASPWNKSIPVEMQAIFTHFLKAARIVRELKADPEDYVKAQFEGLRWTKKAPFPGQLHSDQARLRYAEWMKDRGEKESKRVTPKDTQTDFDLEVKRLNKLRFATGIMQPTVVLRMFKDRFSKEFRESRGVP